MHNRPVLILFFTLVVVMLGFGIVIPILPFYVVRFGGGGSALGGLMAIYGVMQFLFAPLWGSISDRHGRKPILMLGVLGNAIAQLLYGLSTHLWMLFAARALAGILSSATLPTAMAYIGDSTEQSERGGKMGMIGAAMGLGMVVGPGLGGWIAHLSLSAPFFLASGLSLVALVLVFVLLPESHPSGPVQLARPKRSRLGALASALRSPIGLLFLISFLISFGLTNFEGIFGLYAQLRYDFTPAQVGTVLTFIGLIAAATQVGLVGPTTRRWGEVVVMRAALLGSAIGFILMLLAQNLVQLLVTSGLFVLSNALLNPAVAALISKRTPEEQGFTMGVANSFLSLGRIAGPLWAGLVFDIRMFLPYLTGAVIMMIGFLLSLSIAAESRQSASLPAQPA
ncbi:MAG: MFS transporter [Anaerolineales bacterium]|nr:MFS transporter [Anaerolineales bacterium]MCS7247857.1 MFS transporter [Anaerolineales bacterium]MDW8161667.1 MFS transporter [Anaerolineales bacterium]MDW8446975.1 MFS transporter [Anaerolineales bacterium]